MKEENVRPNIKPEWSIIEKILQIVCLMILVAGVVLLIVTWGGFPNNYGFKKELTYLSIVAIGIYLALTAYERFPYIFNFPIKITEKNALYEYQTAREMMVCVKAEIIAVINYLLLASIEKAKGVWQGFGSWFLIVFIALLTATIVYYIRKMSRYKDEE